MPGTQSDSLDFVAKYKDWAESLSIVVNANTSKEDVARFLVAVREDIDRRAFGILGVSLDPVEQFATNAAKALKRGNYSSMVDAYRMLGSKESEGAIDKASSGREELVPFAKAYLLRCLFSNTGIGFYIAGSNAAFGKSAAVPKPGKDLLSSSEAISFMAKYGTWISIKKMSIDDKTKPEEVAAHLSSIRIAVDRKIAETLGVDTVALDEYAATKTNGMRKSAANLEKTASIMADGETARVIKGACRSEQRLEDAAHIYLLSQMLRNIKIDLDVSPDTLMDMFPGLKIPKPKGRMPGQKKKK